MSFNILDLVKDQLSDQVMGQIGGLLGETPETTRSAMSGAVPAILSGFAGIAENKRGADSLFNAAKDQDDSLLDNLGDMLGGDQSGSMIEMGTKLLGGLMGNSGLGSLVGALTGFSGMGKKSSSSLVGLLAPIVLGIIKRKVFGGSSGGTIGALTSLFFDQKDNIANSIPSGMNEQLSKGGFLDSITSNFSDAGEQATQSVQKTATSGGPSIFRKLLLILALLVLGWLALQYFSGQKSAEPVAGNAIETPDFSSQIGEIFKNTTDTFGKITDVATANEQLPNLKGLVDDFTGFSGRFKGLDSITKEPVITLARDAYTELQPVVNNILAVPGVGEVIKPTTDSLIEQINSILN